MDLSTNSFAKEYAPRYYLGAYFVYKINKYGNNKTKENREEIMNNKIMMIIVAVLLTFATIYSIYAIFSEESDIEEEENDTYISEQVSDECTEEYIASQTAKTVSVEEEKVSANALMILKKYYIKCEHTINEYVELPKEIVNMTEEEVKSQYPEWEVIGFSSDKVILYKEFDDVCGEHFKLKVEDGKVVIYKENTDGTESIYEKTNISSEYLTETDLINMQDGLEIYGGEELNKIIEDFE